MMANLTRAELRALQALARFESAREASDHLHLTTQTVRNQAQSAYRKLEVRNRVSAFRKLGWLRPPQAILTHAAMRQPSVRQKS